MDNKKIIILSNFAQNLILFRLEIMLEFLRRGCKVIACAPRDQHFDTVAKTLSANKIELIPIRLNRTGKNLFSDINYIRALFRLFKNEHPDIVFSYMIKPIIYGSIAARLAGVKKIYSEVCGLGYVFINNEWKTKVLRCVVKLLYTFAFRWNSKVIFLNPDDLNLFVNNKIVNKNKAVMVHGSGVNISHYSQKPLPSKLCFLFVGRLIKDKGVNEFLAVAKVMKQKFPQVIFKLVGGYDSNPASITKDELEKVISERMVDYLGVLEDVRPVLESCSVLVLPSYREGVPVSVLEAMATGRAIITTDAPGCRETVIDGVNGFLVPVKSVEKLAEAMEKFILHPELIAQMGQESRRLVEEKFDVHKVNNEILAAMNLK